MRTNLLALAILVGTLSIGNFYGLRGAPPKPGGTPPPPPPTAPQPPHPPNNPPAPATGFGAPIAGLTAAQLTAFNSGRDDFLEVETPQSGLGPIFNEGACVRCHQNPAPGGVSNAPGTSVTRFGTMNGSVFNPLTELGGSLLQAKSIDPIVFEVVPASATIRATRITTPVYGAGLIEAIPDATIQANAAATKPDGVKGRAALVLDVASNQNRVGRFGWKAQQATLLSFAGDAYLNEMGITNRLFPLENAPNGNAALLAQINNKVTITGLQDTVDPKTGLAGIDRLANYMRFLAPPPPRPLSASATAGQAIFQTTGCAVCHTPSMKTSPTAVAPLNNVTVFLYSDLLLHDMGSLNDGIGQAAAGPKEMKTAPLWGLASRPVWLHDGRAKTIDAAITGHAGEAQTSVNRYKALAPAQHQQLLDFLNSL